MPKVLIIGYVWPEPGSSAAGLRDWNLIEAFRSARWELGFASPAKLSPHSERIAALGVPVWSIEANDPRFDDLLREFRPEIVIFDRFVIEEQFGWRVRNVLPECARVLDTQDLHLLRRARARVLENSGRWDSLPDLSGDDADRELASIYRSDLTWVLSDFELGLLKNELGVPEGLLGLLRFFYDPPPQQVAPFGERSGFAMIGNFRHPPNRDAVFWLKRELWPRIRSLLPGAEVRLYGAYPPKDIMELDLAVEGFRVCGWAEDQFEALARARVNLAPLRFGAGIKGKITDGWWSGTPVVATSIGAEGMAEGLPWGGIVADAPDAFAEAAVRLHESQRDWVEKQGFGRAILNHLYSREGGERGLTRCLEALMTELPRRRAQNHVGSMLWHHLNRSTEYFSRWIELKNRG